MYYIFKMLTFASGAKFKSFSETVYGVPDSFFLTAPVFVGYGRKIYL